MNSYICTKTCTTVKDCDVSGAEAVACIPFTLNNYCMPLCHYAGKSYACPTGMKCVQPGGATALGYCNFL